MSKIDIEEFNTLQEFGEYLSEECGLSEDQIETEYDIKI